MFWRALAVLAAVGLVVSGLATVGERSITSLDERSVVIAILPCSGLQSNATGFVIDDRTVLTVAHGIHESRDVAVRDNWGTWHRPEILRLDLENDLAVLRVDDLRGRALEAAPSRRVSEWVGTPVRLLNGASSGDVDGEIVRRVNITTNVIGDRDRQSARSGYEVRIGIGPGDSGAALVDDEERLVGVVFARSTRRQDATWATATDVVDLRRSEIPEWDCGPDPGGGLVLTPPVRERLAG